MSDWIESESLYDRLKKYSESDCYPFHMPGHKRRGVEFANPFAWDITEIDGFDNLHQPEGILKEAMEGAAAFYKSDATFFLVNGSSCGILAAISASSEPGGKILMARNCHQSVYHGALIHQLETRYVYPEFLEEFSLFGGVTAKQVEEELWRTEGIRAVVITSPTYEGLVSDVEKIAETVHRYGALLIVDEAHGAHFPFHPSFPRSALDLGADLVIQSLHKTLPSLTQTALLHMKGKRVDDEKIRKYLSVYQSSSPSYVLLASIDRCIRHMAGSQGKNDMEKYVNHLQKLRTRLSAMKKIKLLDKDMVGSYGIFALDQGKIILSVKGTDLTGQKLYRLFREGYHLQLEMYSDTAITLMTSVNDSLEGFKRLADAAKSVDNRVKRKNVEGAEKKGSDTEDFFPVWKPVPAVTVMSIAQAVSLPHRLIPLKKSKGETAAEMVCPYPPGIPVLVPGEQIGDFQITWIQNCLLHGLKINGLIWKENIPYLSTVSG